MQEVDEIPVQASTRQLICKCSVQESRIVYAVDGGIREDRVPAKASIIKETSRLHVEPFNVRR